MFERLEETKKKCSRYSSRSKLQKELTMILDKDCPLNEEVKGMEEVKYGEFSQPFPNNIYDGRFKGGYDQPLSGEKRPSLIEIINKYMEEASKRQAEQDEWLKKFYQSTEASRETHDKIIQGLEGNEQETDGSGMAEAVAALEATLKKKREEPKKHHAEEALVHQTMKSLKKIKINRPLLKEIRQTDNYAKQMKYLVENKPRTEEDNEIRMNPKCLALLQNHLSPKEQDPRSFILLCSIGKLDFKNGLADLGAGISIMPFSMYKRLGIGKLEPINMLIEMADNTKCTPKGIVKNLLIKIDKFIFPVDFVILDMVEDIRMPIILGRPLLATTHAQVDIFRKTISLEVGSEKVIFKMRSSFTTTNFESVRSIKSKTFIEDDYLKEIDYDLFLYDYEYCEFNRKRFGDKEDDLEEYLEDPKECREDKENTILGVIHDNLNNDWFNNTSEDEDDLEGILDYFKPRSYDGFIDVDDEAYNKRMCRLLGMTYEEPTSILIEKAKLTRYTVGLRETYTKVKVLGVENIPRTRDNVAAMRARLMKKMAQEGNNQAKTYSVLSLT
ncbi:zinc knuckle CX2CX4HX4C containing protein [Tanacetum coccineum]